VPYRSRWLAACQTREIILVLLVVIDCMLIAEGFLPQRAPALPHGTSPLGLHRTGE
jgi:hypothetical protein